jgi:plasmid replication initiation protein
MAKPPENLPDNQVASQRNDLIHGQQTLSLVQKRIFALTLKQIGRNDDDLKMYTLDLRDLVQAGTSSSIFSTIESEADSLMKKVLLKKEKIEGSKHPKTTRWGMVSKAIHHPGEGTLSIRLNPEIRDMLLELKEQGGFTPVPIAELMACRSTYGQRLYELLYSWRREQRWEVSMDKLRFILDLEGKYENFSMFRTRVLEKAQNDLKANTNMRFEWKAESRVKGRKITHLIFTFDFIADQMGLPLEDKPKNRYRDLPYNLLDRLKNVIGLDKKQLETVQKWIQNRPEQDHPMSKWIHKKFEEDKNPVDSSGTPIRSYSDWFMAQFNKTFQEAGFPKKIEGKQVFAPDIPENEL